MIFGAILAGGTGTRMNISSLPKQFLPLGSKPVIIHTLEKFLTSGCFDHVYLGIHPKWTPYMTDLLDKNQLNFPQVHITDGGIDRNRTIQNIISAIETDWGSCEEHILVTHDAVRPFVSFRVIQENVAAAQQYGACDTVISATDTIVASEDGKMIQSIPKRNYMYQGQTPQSFNMNLLKKLYLQLSHEELESLTDACKICVLQHIPVYLVRGEVSNIKLTTIEDYKIAQAMLEEKNCD